MNASRGTVLELALFEGLQVQVGGRFLNLHFLKDKILVRLRGVGGWT